MSTGKPATDPVPDLARRGFRVGDWDVHPLLGVIEQGGHRVHVEPKVMDVLLCLARHEGQVVTRDLLLQEVWPGVVVTDDVVTRCVSELRTVLRDTGRDRRFIRTIPKRGYSLLLPVVPLPVAAGEAPPGPVAAPGPAPEAAPPPPPSAIAPGASPPAIGRRVLDDAGRLARQATTTTRSVIRTTLLGIGVLIVGLVGLVWTFSGDDGVKVTVVADDDSGAPAAGRPAIRSVAVLPLVSLSGNSEHEYFSEGLAEDIRNALIGATDLRVAARTSSTAFRNKPMDVREIARQLNVEALLEGTVRLDSERLRVTTQLTDGRSGYPIWASSFERAVTDKLALQAEVAEAILKQLAPSIAIDRRKLTGATGNEQAHDAYLLGRWYWNQRTREGLERSVGHFEQALALDPAYALAMSGLADAWLVLLDNGYRTREETLPKARQYAARAVELDDSLAESHASMGMVYTQEGDLRRAVAEYQKAVDLKPGYSMAQMWLGMVMLSMGDANRAASHQETALKLDPLHPSVQYNYLASLLARGQLDQARSEGQRLMDLAPGDMTRRMLAQTSLELGQYDEVLTLAVSLAGSDDSSGLLTGEVIEALIYLQRLDEAQRLLDEQRDNLDPYLGLSLQAGLAVARRDPALLRRAAAGLQAPAIEARLPPGYRGCNQRWIALWLGIAELLADQPGRAAPRFRVFTGDEPAPACAEEKPALRLAGMAYALEGAARLNGGRPPAGAAAAASREVERYRALGWNDAWFNTADLAIRVLAGDEAGTTALLDELRGRGMQPYGRMRAWSLYDQLWDRPALAAARSELEAGFEATRERAAAIKLTKLGL
jgi:TolB-like protein/DNA-binding winged helix-turn-helix (wHTH) protein